MKRFNRFTVEAPNANNREEWLAGGELRNATYPGGAYYSPTKIPSFDNKPCSLDIGASLLKGYYNYLNPSFTAINSFVNIGMFELLAQNKESYFISYTIEISNTNTLEILDSSSNIIDISDSSGFDHNFSNNDFSMSPNASNMSRADIQQSLTTSASFSFENPISLAMSITNMMNNEDMSIEQGLMGMTVNTVTNNISMGISKSLAPALGIANPLGILGLTTIVGAIVTETMQMALGVDNSFGYGGEYDRDFSNTFGVDAFSKSKGLLGLESLAESLTHSLKGLVGLESTMTTEFTNFDKTAQVGYRTDVQNLNNIDFSISGDMQGNFSASFDSLSDMHSVMGETISMQADIGKSVNFSMDIDPTSPDYGSVSIGQNDNSDFGTPGTNDPNNADMSNNATESDFNSDFGSDFGSSNDSGGFGYGGGDGGGDSDSGSGDSGTWICTASSKLDLIDKDTLKVMKHYGIRLRREDKYLMRTYDLIGKKLAGYVKKEGLSAKAALFLIGYYRALNSDKKLTRGQRAFHILSRYILRPLYRVIGRFLKRG